MKHKFAKTLAVLLLSSSSALAQYVGAGGSTPLQKIKAEDGPWKTRFYIYMGPSMPIGMWNKAPDPSAALSDMYVNNTGMGAKTGFYMEMGNMFYLKKIALPENMGVAINATYLNFSTHAFDLSSLGNQFQGDDNTKFNFFSMKIGAQFTYIPVKKVYLDAYFNLAPTFGALGTVWSDDDQSYNYDFYVDRQTLAVGLRKNFGINARYSVFTFGLDFMTGAVKSDMYVYVRDVRTNSTMVSEYFESRFKANSLQLKFGFTF